MGLFKDLGCLVGEVAEATGECIDDLIKISAGAACDLVEEATRPRKRVVVRKVTRYEVVEEEEDLSRVLFGSRWGRW